MLAAQALRRDLPLISIDKAFDRCGGCRLWGSWRHVNPVAYTENIVRSFLRCPLTAYSEGSGNPRLSA